jgi:hypothetical protein
VAPLFHYVEKGYKNDGDVSCSVTAKFDFLPCQAGNEISWQNFHEISRNFIDHPKYNPLPFPIPDTENKLSDQHFISGLVCNCEMAQVDTKFRQI